MDITATLIVQMVSFMLLIWFVNKVLWGPMSKLMEDRQKRIADGLAAGDKGRHELKMADKRAKEVLQESKSRAVEILAQSEKRAGEIVEEAKGKAHEEGQRLLHAARAEIDQEVNRAKEHLREQLATLAVAGASRVLEREIDANAHNDLMKDLVAEI